MLFDQCRPTKVVLVRPDSDPRGHVALHVPRAANSRLRLVRARARSRTHARTHARTHFLTTNAQGVYTAGGAAAAGIEAQGREKARARDAIPGRVTGRSDSWESLNGPPRRRGIEALCALSLGHGPARSTGDQPVKLPVELAGRIDGRIYWSNRRITGQINRSNDAAPRASCGRPGDRASGAPDCRGPAPPPPFAPAHAPS